MKTNKIKLKRCTKTKREKCKLNRRPMYDNIVLPCFTLCLWLYDTLWLYDKFDQFDLSIYWILLDAANWTNSKPLTALVSPAPPRRTESGLRSSFWDWLLNHFETPPKKGLSASWDAFQQFFLTLFGYDWINRWRMSTVGFQVVAAKLWSSTDNSPEVSKGRRRRCNTPGQVLLEERMHIKNTEHVFSINILFKSVSVWMFWASKLHPFFSVAFSSVIWVMFKHKTSTNFAAVSHGACAKIRQT